MEIEKQRGISVTSSVLQFNYNGFCINILDTPYNKNFSVNVVLPASGCEMMANVLLFSTSLINSLIFLTNDEKER